MSPTDTYTGTELRSTLQTFRGYLRDLTSSSFGDFPTKLRLFVNYCERDDVFRLVAHHLTARGPDAREWFTRVAQGLEPRDVPAGEDRFGRLAFVYRILHDTKQQRIELRSLLSTLFSGTSIDDAFARFKAHWLDAFAADMGAALDAMEAGLPSDAGDGKVDFDQLALDALAGRPSNAPPPAPAPVPTPARAPARPAPARPAATPKPGAKTKPPAKAQPRAQGPAKAPPPAAATRHPADERDLGTLVRALAAAGAKQRGIKAADRKDLETDVKILKLALSKSDPSREVVLSVVQPLERHGGKVAELAAAIAIHVKRSSAVS